MTDTHEPLSDAEIDQYRADCNYIIKQDNPVRYGSWAADTLRLIAEVERLHDDLVFCDGIECGPDSASCGSCGWCGDPDYTNGEYHCPRCGPGAEGFAWDSYRDGVLAENKRLRAEVERYKKRLFEMGAMEEAPCIFCGYNGPGYFQPDTHPCAALHHAAMEAPHA